MNKFKLIDIWYYIQGTVRYKLYYSKYFSWLIPVYIHEQIDFRINSMDRKCYMQGSCIICGCKTTALQMSNKMCGKPCYPKMVNRSKWKFWKTFNKRFLKPNKYDILWKLDMENKKFIKNE